MRVSAHRLGQHSTVHVGVAPWLLHQCAPNAVTPLARTQACFSSIVLPGGRGKPSTISRSGSPATWASIVLTRRIMTAKCTLYPVGLNQLPLLLTEADVPGHSIA